MITIQVRHLVIVVVLGVALIGAVLLVKAGQDNMSGDNYTPQKSAYSCDFLKKNADTGDSIAIDIYRTNCE